MEHTDSQSPSAPSSHQLPAHLAHEPLPELDAHGHNLADYEWVPVLRKRRADGWSPQKQRAFIEALADGGSVTRAARAVGMSRDACYKLRRSPGAENFDRAWSAAIAVSSKQLIDIAFDRAVNGVEEPVFDKDGQRIACRYRYNDRLLMFLIRAHAPEQYRHAHRDERAREERLPAPAPDVADAMRLLEPETPPDPHLLLSPDELDDALTCADLLDGELPRWKRDPDPHALPAQGWHTAEVERRIEAARDENAGDET